MSISKPTPRATETFIGSSNKPTWNQLKCIYALNKGQKYTRPNTREEASQMIQHLKSGGKFGTGFQLLKDLADLKTEVKSENTKKPVVTKTVTKTVINRATLKQKMCIYAIAMNLWNDVKKAKELSNLVKTRDEASDAIQGLKELQH